MTSVRSVMSVGRQPVVPVATMGLDDAAHAGLGGLLVEKDAAASVYLDVDKTGRQDHIGGKVDSRAQPARRS